MPAGLGQDLLWGAAAIAEFVFSKDTPTNRRKVYHKQKSWPIWKDGSELVSRRSALQAHFQGK